SLQGVLPHPFRFALVKGRGNYLSKRRLGVAIAASQDVFPDFVPDDVAEQLTKIATWSVGGDHDGSRDQLEFPPSPDVWNEVMSDDDHCLGKNCTTHKECFYYASRRKMKGAHVLVVNHSLYMTCVNLARQGVEILPEHAVLVIDEAHTLEAVASAHLGETVSNVQIMRLLNRVHHERTGKGILRGVRGEKRGAADDAWLGQAVATVNRARNAADVFFGAAKAFMDKRERDVIRFRDEPHPEEWTASEAFIEAMKVLTTELNSVAARLRERQRKAKINREVIAAQRLEVAAMDAEAVAKSCCTLTATLHVWLKHLEPDAVYWITQETKKGLVITLTYAPLHLGPVLKQHLWDKVPTCILTSATLAVGNPANFDHVRDRLGLEDEAVATLAVGSPFDYANNVTLFLNRDLPDPGDPSRRVDNAFERQAIRSLPRHLWKTQGNAFVLFTSNVMMREAERVLRSWIEARGWPLLIQGDLPPAKLIERFKAGGSVLFGVDSFWTGVDVRGPALSNVIITKLPFPRPGQPLLDARLEDFKARGGDPFSGYLVPEAIIKLKQGFGRLIRSRTDSGIVIILDPRITTKFYGRTFLDSLPACPRVVEDLRPAPSVAIAEEAGRPAPPAPRRRCVK
ncbi:MAG: hypothetical protein JO329_05960, partial [Planctomycetaceae bacterium]|nr:hypothetical protein [Planctomycetaceae bacterium]